MDYKVGIGYDIHKLVEGRKLILGGLEIPYSKGLLGHSDADVLLHAICDALLGAIGEPDIGEQFPDTDPKYKGASSVELLKKVLGLVNKKGFLVNNIDSIVIAQEPPLSAHKSKIQKNVASILGIDEDNVSIKAKTNEGLGQIGAGSAIASYAIASLMRRE